MTDHEEWLARLKQAEILTNLLRKYGVDPQEFYEQQRDLAKALVAFFATLEEGGDTHGNH